MPRRARTRQPIKVESLSHTEDSRPNIPSAEMETAMEDADRKPIYLAYERRNRDLDPQLVWSGKDEQDARDLIAPAPPLFIQEKVHPKVLVDDLMRFSSDNERADEYQVDLFADFNGLPSDDAKTEFYQHDANWSNRMILGDSLQVMASLAEREGLRGKVQCIYVDPPYGIRFNSNFQWSTTSRDVRDGNAAHIPREPEQVRAFRDTWQKGIHTYLSYLRDRLTVARDLLADSGSIFVQIGDENVHRVRVLMDEVFGDDNFISLISNQTTTGFPAEYIGNISDHVLWYAKNKSVGKSRRPFFRKSFELGAGNARWLMFEDFTYRGVTTAERRSGEFPEAVKPYAPDNLISQGRSREPQPFLFQGKIHDPWDRNSHWKANFPVGMERLAKAGRLHAAKNSIRFVRYHSDFELGVHGNIWTDTSTGNFTDDKLYVVQTNAKVVERCILMATDPGDLILDPTCGSGTTAYVAEQWGRRWITIDTSRVALALARARVMGARYPYYLLADSPEGQAKQAEIERRAPSESATYGDVRQGFVYERVPHITLRDIANNAEIDVIWEEAQEELEPLRRELSVASGQWSESDGEEGRPLEEWEIPRERPEDWPPATEDLLIKYWERRIARQKEIDASIAAKADYEYLYDKPYEARRKVRVAGPFTVESLSPHRVLVSGDVESEVDETGVGYRYDGEVPERDFAALMLDNLRTSGVQQAQKADKIDFTSVTGWPGTYICAEGRYMEGETERRAGIFIGPEFGTVARADLVAAAREAADAGCDALIACAFSYEAQTTSFNKFGRLQILKARMNADLHMADTLKSDSKGNLFVIFGEPDISVASGQWLVTSNGRMAANFEAAIELSGLGSLEEINRVGRDGLSSLCQLSAGGEVRHYQPGAPGGSVGGGQHSGGRGASWDGGVSQLPGNSERLAGGNGDVSDIGATTGDGQPGASAASSGAGVGNWTDAQRAQTLAALQNLTPADFPLSLTTDHWSQVTIRGVDIYHPATGQVRSDDTDGIACWFVDTDYNEESFFVRHAYFLGAGDPYKALKTSLKAEINAEAWATLYGDTSRPFPRPASGRVAVKVINHLGDEAMKVIAV